MRVDDLVAELGISPATVRRDLDTLADQQLITRTRGGAVANAVTGEIPMRYRAVTRPKEKAAIARAVAALIQPGEVVGFNGGTTTTLAAWEVGVRVAADEAFADDELTLVTNAVNIANDLIVRPMIRVVLTGGVARARSYELIGPLAQTLLGKISISTLFLGVNALDLDSGIYAHHEGEAAISAALIRAAERVVVLTDSTKIGHSAFARIARLDDITTVITDAGIADEDVRALHDRGVDVIVADHATTTPGSRKDT